MWLTYNLLLYIALPFFCLYGLLKKKIRVNLYERLFPDPLPDAHGVIWVHAASIGEAIIAQTLIEYMDKTEAERFVVTVNTYYARDMLRKRFGSTVQVRSLPFDLPRSLKRFIGRAQVRALIIIETELWPNLVRIASGKKIPVIITNGRISDKTVGRYKRLSFFLKRLLSFVTLVLAQSDEHAQRFIALGMDPARIITTGNLKYYREIPFPETGLERPNVITFGSVKEKEFPIVIPAIATLLARFPDLLVYLAPREIQLVEAIESRLPAALRPLRYSAVKAGRPIDTGLVLVDTVGDLMRIYSRSKAAFVGGSLAPYGGQNMLEPLFVGTPVLFGPHTENFRLLAADILRMRAGILVTDKAELESAVEKLLTDEPMRRQLIASAGTVIEAQKNSIEITTRYIREIICRNSRSS